MPAAAPVLRNGSQINIIAIAPQTALDPIALFAQKKRDARAGRSGEEGNDIAEQVSFETAAVRTDERRQIFSRQTRGH